MKLDYVTEADFNHCERLKGDGFKALIHLPRLRELTVSHTDINDSALHWITQMQHLTNLDMGSTDIDDAGIAEIARSPLNDQLDSLCLSDMSLTAKSMPLLAKMPKLTSLNLRSVDVDDAAVNMLTTSKTLRSLKLQHTNIKGSCLKQLASMDSLRKLGLSKNVDLKRSLSQLIGSKINELDLSTCGLSDEDIPTLTKITSLKTIGLLKNEITDHGLMLLLKLPGLKSVDLRDTLVSSDGVAAFQAALVKAKRQSPRIEFGATLGDILQQGVLSE
jgi:Leucine-rich repeat (LRR) protein